MPLATDILALRDRVLAESSERLTSQIASHWLEANDRLDIIMKFLVTIDRDEDGAWVVNCPSIPGCVSQGQTKDEALDNVRDAIQACLQVRAERGMPLTVETQQVEVTA